MIKEKPTKKEIVVFGLGDMLAGAITMIGFFYLIFVTDVLKISPAYAGFVVLISRFWDAISDPLMGVITDGTNSKYGRRRPYMFAGFFGIITAFPMIWWPVNFESQFLTFIYMLFTFLFFFTVVTMVMVPYISFSTELSMDYQDRSVINGTRLFFSQLSVLIGAVLPMTVVGLAPTIRSGYALMGILFGLFFAVPYLLIFFTCHERAPITKKQDKVTFGTFVAPFKIKVFRTLVLIYLLTFLSIDMLATILAHYMTYLILRPGELSITLGVMLLASLTSVPVSVKASTMVGKAKTFMYSASIWITGVLLLGFYNLAWPAWSIYAIAVVAGAGVGGCSVMLWVMFPDVTDVGELAFGERRTGSFSGIMTFLRKSSSALGIFSIGLMLEFTGFAKPLVTNGEEVLQEQPEAVIIGLRSVVLITVVLIVIAIYLARKYPLSRAISDKLSGYLKYKRGEEKESNLTEAEVKDLEKLLL